jgi:SAM-dependent methyltransferase
MNPFVKSLAKSLLPNQLYSELQKPFRKVRQFLLYSCFAKKIRYFGTAHYCPICRSHIRILFPFGVPPRLNAECPVCGSLERHRLVFLFLSQRTDLFLPPKKRMLHIAPEDCLADIFKKNEFINYISADIAPYAMLEMDLTDIFFPDETFDVIFVSHVFEHIVDDRKAMREIFRTLKTKGSAILQVPIKAEVTFEDPNIINPKDRERYFGQNDHVRIYGKDYYDRLIEAGFTVHRERLSLQENNAMVKRLGLSPNEEITFCTKA